MIKTQTFPKLRLYSYSVCVQYQTFIRNWKVCHTQQPTQLRNTITSVVPSRSVRSVFADLHWSTGMCWKHKYMLMFLIECREKPRRSDIR